MPHKNSPPHSLLITLKYSFMSFYHTTMIAIIITITFTHILWVPWSWFAWILPQRVWLRMRKWMCVKFISFICLCWSMFVLFILFFVIHIIIVTKFKLHTVVRSHKPITIIWCLISIYWWYIHIVLILSNDFHIFLDGADIIGL